MNLGQFYRGWQCYHKKWFFIYFNASSIMTNDSLIE